MFGWNISKRSIYSNRTISVSIICTIVVFKTLDKIATVLIFCYTSEYTLIKQSNFKHNFLHEHNIEHNVSKFWALQHSIIGKKMSIIGWSLVVDKDYFFTINTSCITRTNGYSRNLIRGQLDGFFHSG